MESRVVYVAVEMHYDNRNNAFIMAFMRYMNESQLGLLKFCLQI